MSRISLHNASLRQVEDRSGPFLLRTAVISLSHYFEFAQIPNEPFQTYERPKL